MVLGRVWGRGAVKPCNFILPFTALHKTGSAKLSKSIKQMDVRVRTYIGYIQYNTGTVKYLESDFRFGAKSIVFTTVNNI
jgi:hypothetical protein